VVDCRPAVIVPLSLTVTGPASGDVTLSRKALPRLLTTAGPVNWKNSITGRSDTAASSSARVGARRTSVNWFGCQPPIAVIHWPSGTPGRRAARICWTWLIDVALSIGVW
jgi:hypothetical protein